MNWEITGANLFKPIVELWMKDANSSTSFILKVEAEYKVSVLAALVSVALFGTAVTLSVERGVLVPPVRVCSGATGS